MNIRSRRRTAMLLGVLLFITSVCELAAQDTTYQWAYGGTDHDRFYGVTGTGDGGHIAVGSTGAAVYVVRVNSCGQRQWANTYDIGLSADARKVVRGHDGGYVIVGTAVSPASCCATGRDPFVMKINDAGSVLWTQTYPGLNDDYGYDIIRYGISEYVIAGGTNSFGAGSTDGFLIRIGLTGQPVAARTYGSTGGEVFTSVSAASNGDIIAAGSSWGSFTSDGVSQIFVVRTGSDLSPQWSHHYGGDSVTDVTNDVVAMSDGSIVVLGYTTRGSIYSGERPYLLKLTAIGKCSCDAIYAYTDSTLGELTEGVELANGDLAVTGFYFNEPLGQGRFDVLLMRLNTDCTINWARQYGTEWRDQGFSLVPVYTTGVLLPTGYVIAAQGNSFSNGGFDDGYLIRTDGNGRSGCNEYKTVIARKSPQYCGGNAPITVNLFSVACGVPATRTSNFWGELVCTNCPIPWNDEPEGLLSRGRKGEESSGIGREAMRASSIGR